MATFDHQKAIAEYTELMRCIHIGAYQERNEDGTCGEDGIEAAVDRLDIQAWDNVLEYRSHKDDDGKITHYTLEPMTEAEQEAYKVSRDYPPDDAAEWAEDEDGNLQLL